MPDCRKGNVIVTGTPGSWPNLVAGLLQDLGWAVTWKGQDIDIRNGTMFRDHNKQNIELHLMHQILCWREHTSLASADLPEFYETPYPGPREFMSMFDEPVVLSGTCLAPFLDLWVEAATVVIDIRATEVEDLNTLRNWSGNSSTDKQLKVTRARQLDRYARHLKLFPAVHTMANEDVKHKRFDELLGFLNSVF